MIEGQFEIKEDCLDQSLFICLKYNKFHPTLPLNAKLLGEIVTSRAVKFGFKAKSVSGHCLRKGTATQIILNEIIENGVSSDKTYRALEEHIGWVPHTKVTKTYVNDITSRLRDSTKFVSGDKRDSIDIKDVASITFAPTEVVVKQEKRTCNKEYLFRIVKATEGMNKNEKRNFIKKDKLRVFKSLPEVTQNKLLNEFPSVYSTNLSKLLEFAEQYNTTVSFLRKATAKKLRTLKINTKDVESIMKSKKHFFQQKESAILTIAKKIINNEIKVDCESPIDSQIEVPEDDLVELLETEGDQIQTPQSLPEVDSSDLFDDAALNDDFIALLETFLF